MGVCVCARVCALCVLVCVPVRLCACVTVRGETGWGGVCVCVCVWGGVQQETG